MGSRGKKHMRSNRDPEHRLQKNTTGLLGLLCMAFAAAVLACGVCGAEVNGTIANEEAKGEETAGVLATVNGVPITEEELQVQLRILEDRVEGRSEQEGAVDFEEESETLLEKLITGEIFYQEAVRQGIEVSDAEMAEKLQKFKESFAEEGGYEKKLEKLALSEDQVAEIARRNLLTHKLVETEVIAKIEVPDEEVKAYYDRNLIQFTTPEKVCASHILIAATRQDDKTVHEAARERIRMIEEKLKSGEDFEVLAKEYSDCPTRQKAGSLGCFSRGGMIIPPIEDAAFAMKEGELSGIIHTKLGYHLVKVTERQPEKVAPFEEIRDGIKEKMREERIQKEVNLYFENLKMNAKVERY